MTTVRKVCNHCGRVISPRKMRDHDWNRLKYCSSACRRSAGAHIHRRIEERILGELDSRKAQGTICPSEVAQALFGSDFRRHMEDVRRGARRLAHRGEIVITQGGREVEPSAFKGPIRLSRKAR